MIAAAALFSTPWVMCSLRKVTGSASPDCSEIVILSLANSEEMTINPYSLSCALPSVSQFAEYA